MIYAPWLDSRAARFLRLPPPAATALERVPQSHHDAGDLASLGLVRKAKWEMSVSTPLTIIFLRGYWTLSRSPKFMETEVDSWRNERVTNHRRLFLALDTFCLRRATLNRLSVMPANRLCSRTPFELCKTHRYRCDVFF